MSEVDPFEPGTHTFTGTIKAWHEHSGELVTESGLVIIFSTQNHPAMQPGTRATLTLRKFRPRYALAAAQAIEA